MASIAYCEPTQGQHAINNMNTDLIMVGYYSMIIVTLLSLLVWCFQTIPFGGFHFNRGTPVHHPFWIGIVHMKPTQRWGTPLAPPTAGWSRLARARCFCYKRQVFGAPEADSVQLRYGCGWILWFMVDNCRKISLKGFVNQFIRSYNWGEHHYAICCNSLKISIFLDRLILQY